MNPHMKPKTTTLKRLKPKRTVIVRYKDCRMGAPSIWSVYKSDVLQHPVIC
jgi:hypothetical protein